MLAALARHNRPNYVGFVRITLWAAIETIFWVAGLLAETTAMRMAFWGGAIVILNGAPMLAYWLPGLGATDTRVWDIEGHHFSERCGLFIIIALGESILVTGAAFGAASWDAATIAAFASAFTCTLAMWWLYFDVGAERAARQLTEDADPGRMARLAYTYFHIPIVAGIIVTAASDEMALAHPLGHAGIAEIACLIGGPALYLFGNLIFKRTTARHFPLPPGRTWTVGLAHAFRVAAVAADPLGRRDRDPGAGRHLGDALAEGHPRDLARLIRNNRRFPSARNALWLTSHCVEGGRS